MKVKSLFITGTDTGVGKTLVTGCLARFLQEEGYKVITQKWIQTGCSSKLSSDIKEHLKIMDYSIRQVAKGLPWISPYVFRTAASPHLASEIEKRRIDPHKIIRGFQGLSRQFDFVIVEGAGGVLVPFNKKRLLIDLVKELNLPVLVVAGNRLGAINHILLTIEALARRKMHILGIIFNNICCANPPNSTRRVDLERILKDNPRIIKALTSQKIFGVLPYAPTYSKLYKEFIPVGKKILRLL